MIEEFFVENETFPMPIVFYEVGWHCFKKFPYYWPVHYLESFSNFTYFSLCFIMHSATVMILL